MEPSLARQLSDRTVVMSKTRPAQTETAQPAPGFATTAHSQLGSGIIVTDGREISVLTPAAARILGLKPAPGPGSPLKSLPPALEKIALEALKFGEAKSGLVIEIKTSRGESGIVGVSVVPLQGDHGKNRLLLVLDDIGSARQLEEKLWRIDRLANVGTLAAGMAHEIKNALVAGKTFIDLLLEKNRDVELVDVVRRELSRIDAIVTRMLKFSGPDRAMTSTVSLHQILEHSLRLVQPHREDKLIALKESLRAVPDSVRGDDYQLQQAFVNLLLNALEAMGPNGTLTVATESGNGNPGAQRIHIIIADDGDGIAPEHLERVFDPFFTTKSEGTGLGLPITRRIIEAHQGTVTVNSRPKEGTTFRITLPSHVGDEPAS